MWEIRTIAVNVLKYDNLKTRSNNERLQSFWIIFFEFPNFNEKKITCFKLINHKIF